ncbi:MAG: thiamine phosphate synthase, partial [Brevibacterium sp.]|nr:thiamine phosphate synthase [Brevibacterium sp.]
PGRPAIGLEPLRALAATATKPWFAIGGISAGQRVAEVRAAGGQRIVVVRAVTGADDPSAAATQLRQAL